MSLRLGLKRRRLEAIRGVLVFCATVCCALPAASQVAQPRIGWSSVGPSSVSGWSGKINAFAYRASDPKVMYTAGGWGNTPRETPSQAGIYRTVDGGRHWDAIDDGLTAVDGTISSTVNGLWLDQRRPLIMLASTEFGGTFRSTDGGDRWTNVDRTEGTQFAQSGATLYLATLRGILASTNDGKSWTLSLQISGGATSVVTAGGSTLAGSAGGDVYALSHGKWTKVGRPGTGAIHNIAIDPFRPATVYASVDDKAAWNQDLYASLNGGKTWNAVYGNWSLGAQAIAFSLVVPHRIYLGDDGSQTIFNFTADGNAYPTLQPGSYLYGVDMRYIIPVPGRDKTDDACYALMDQGLFFAAHCASGSAPSLDQSVRKFLAYDVAPGASGRNLLIPLQDMGTGSSTNFGGSWTQLDNTGEGAEAVLDPFRPQACYMAHPDNGLYISHDSCATVSYVSQVGISSLAFAPHTSRMYAITNPDQLNANVSYSVNGGYAWRTTGWRFKYPYQVVVSPKNANEIILASGTLTSLPEVNYSHDGGKTFHLAGGLPTRVPATLPGLDYPVHRYYAAFDPKVPSTILLVDHDPASDDIILYRSVDAGQTFKRVSTLVEPKPPRLWPHLLLPNPNENPVHPKPGPDVPYYATRFFGNRIGFNPNAPGSTVPLVVLTTRFGAFASADIGTTWKRIDLTTITHHFIGLAWHNGYVYLASFGQGILKSNEPLQ